MNRCAPIQAQLLEYVYGLLDAEEAQAVDHHLEACATCRLAHERALRQHDRLASASLFQFPKVRFEVPVGEPLVVALNRQDEESVPGAPGWFRWATAASILLLVAGLGIPAGLYSKQRDQLAAAGAELREIKKQAGQLGSYSDGLQGQIAGRLDDARQGTMRADQQYQDQINAVDRQLSEIDRAIKSLTDERDQRLGDLRKKVGASQLHMTIRGPIEPEAGVANHYQVETRTLNQPAAATLSFRVLDSDRRVVFEKEASTKGKFSLALPSSLPLHTPLTLEVRAKNKAGGQQLVETLPLSAPSYLTHLSTDRQAYRPGDTVRYRSLTLDRFTLRPSAQDLDLTFTIHGPNGTPVHTQTGLAQLIGRNDGVLLGPDRKPIRGIGAGSFKLGSDALEGDYLLSVHDRLHRCPAVQRMFRVEELEKVKLRAAIVFDQAGYRPGQRVTASFKPEDEQSRELIKNLGSTIAIDGLEVAIESKRQADGTLSCEFAVPRQLGGIDPRLTLSIPGAGKTYTVEKDVPLLHERVHVGFYPEGGDLIAGVPNSVYFQAWTPGGEPATIRGRIVEDKGRVAADVRTLDPRQGRGRFSFTPTEGRHYRLVIDEPARFKQIFNPAGKNSAALPDPKADGVVMHVADGVVKAGAPLRVQLRSAGKERTLVVSLHCRGQILTQSRVQAPAARAVDVNLTPALEVGGVYRVTVAEEENRGGKTLLTPRAERLVYRLPGARMQLSIKLDKAAYAAGEQVKLKCRARDENDQALPAIVMLAVTEPDAYAEREPGLAGYFLLGSDLRLPQDLEYADFLLDKQVDGEALDLMLATQGWRRFVEAEAKEAEKAPLLALNEVKLEVSPFIQRKQKLEAALAGKLAPLQERQIEASVNRRGLIEKRQGARQQLEELRGELQQQALAEERLIADKQRALEVEVERAQARYDAAAAALDSYDGVLEKVRHAWTPVLAVLLLLAGVVGLGMSVFRRSWPQMIPYLATAACGVALLGFLASLQISSVDERAAAPLREDPVWGRIDPGASVARLDQMNDEIADVLKKLPAEPTEQVAKATAAPAPRPDAGKEQAALKKLELQRERYRFERRAMKKHEKIAVDANSRAAYGGAGSLESAKDKLVDKQRNQANAVVELSPPFIVREYAHRQAKARAGAYAATLYWHPALVLANGDIEVSFDRGTGRNYRILAAGHTLDGLLDSITLPVPIKDKP